MLYPDSLTDTTADTRANWQTDLFDRAAFENDSNNLARAFDCNCQSHTSLSSNEIEQNLQKTIPYYATDNQTVFPEVSFANNFESKSQLDNDNNQDPILGLQNCHCLVGKPFELLADSNRDGLVDDRDRQDKTVWNDKRGAIMLPNLDDDGGKVKQFNLDDSDPEADAKLAKLNDANDNIVNGTEDEKDLAPLKITPWQDAPADTSVKISVDDKSSPYVRLFVKRNGEYQALDSDDALTVSELQQGAELAVEAKDVVRDSSVWDGFVTLSLEAKTGEQTFSDRVKMRVSPLLFKNNLMPVQNLYLSNQPETQINPESIAQAATQSGIDPSSINPNDVEKFIQQDVEQKLNPSGIQTKWIDSWYYTRSFSGGDVHCATNTLRDPSTIQPWWQQTA